MEQITKKGSSFYYGAVKCISSDEAYRMFREDIHSSIGRDSTKRLNRLGQRTDLIHWRGFVFDRGYFSPDRYEYDTAVNSRIIGIIGSSYCRIIGLWDIPDIDDAESDYFFDWLLEDGNRALRLTNRKGGLGRNNKRHNKNYR